MASQNGHSRIVSVLLNDNADPNLSRDDGTAPLIGNSRIVSVLLNANADPNLCRDDGTTPLIIASRKGHSEIVCLLLKANADPNLGLHTEDGVTPLHCKPEWTFWG